MQEDKIENKPAKPRRGLIARFNRFVFLTLSLGLFIKLYFFGWEEIYQAYLEEVPPQIVLAQVPRGVGAGLVSLKVQLNDDGAGLDEVVLRIRQKGQSREVFRKSLASVHNEEVTVNFQGDKSELEEGQVYLELRAFDRSFWSNTSEVDLRLRVDFRRPRVEVVTAQHNARVGGSQFIIYRAQDQDLLRSGVQVNGKKFVGVKANLLDPEFADDIYACIFAIPPGLNPKQVKMQLFAEDEVGNFVVGGFNHTLAGRRSRSIRVKLTPQLVAQAAAIFVSYNPGEQRIDAANELQVFDESIKEIVPADRDKLEKLILKESFYEQFFQSEFQKQPGIEQTLYADTLVYVNGDQEVSKILEEGTELIPNQKDVIAASEGRVIFAGDLGSYGKTVVLMHALGVATVYARLSESLVEASQEVTRGQKIGIAGSSGLARNNQVYFQIRVQGQPADPREYWDANWFKPHVFGKIKEAKRSLGMFFKLPKEDEG